MTLPAEAGLRVAQFISTSGLYGAEHWILALLSHLPPAIESLVICPDTSDRTLLTKAAEKGIAGKMLAVTGNFALGDFVRKLRLLLRQERIAILHTHGYKADIVGYFATKSTPVKLLSTPHGWSKDAGLKLRVYEALDRFILRFFDAVAPHTRAFQESLGHLPRLHWIDNFVDLDTVPPPEAGNPYLLTYIGQLIERKRVSDIIVALACLPAQIRLQIIGDGPQKQKLQQLAQQQGVQDRVDFLGFRSDRLQLLNRSQMLILPSLLEWIPRVAMEAMAMSRVVIASDIVGMRYLLEDKATGLLVPIKSPKHIAAAVEYVLANPESAQQIAGQGKALVNGRFSAQRAAEEYYRLYQALASGRIRESE